MVDSEPVARILADFVQRWRQDRPSRRNRYSGRSPFDDEPPADDLEPVAPYTFLAVDTGLAAMHARRQGRVEPTEADISRAENDLKRTRAADRNPLTELRVADAIVASIGDPGMWLGDQPLLVIRPNPKAPAARHGECCSGSRSLNGSGSPR